VKHEKDIFPVVVKDVRIGEAFFHGKSRKNNIRGKIQVGSFSGEL
jgi:hypothetical protein